MLVYWLLSSFTKLNAGYPRQKTNNSNLSSSFNLFKYDSTGQKPNNINLVSSNKTIREELEHFLIKKAFCLESIDCKIKHFNSSSEFEAYCLEEQEYRLDLYIEIDTEMEMSFKVKGQTNNNSYSLLYESIYYSSNLLKIDPLDRRSNMDNWNNIQTLLAEFALETNNVTTVNHINVKQQPLPTPMIYTWLNQDIYPSFVPVLLCFMYLGFITFFADRIVWEKETQLIYLLYRQGISQYLYWSSWLLSYIIWTTLPIILSAVIAWKFIFNNTSLIFILFNMLMINLNLFAFIFLFAANISSVRSAQALINSIYIGVGIFCFAIGRPETSLLMKYLFMFLPQFLQIVNFDNLLLIDNYQSGIDWKLVNIPNNQITLFSVYVMYFVTFIIYLLCGFLLMVLLDSDLIMDAQYYIKNQIKKIKQKRNKAGSGKDDEFNESKGSIVNHEEIIENSMIKDKKNNKILSINDLTKTYGDLKAVNNFTGDFYPNQILCLLGHNGAGKTTLIKTISGLECPDAGDICLDGHSLLKEKQYLYKNIGLCEQENLFFDYMTVTENLEMMCQLKGEEDDREEIDDLLKKIELTEKKNSICKTLSGRQKRKLCILLALIGHSKLILLDEPTSGMDFFSKKFLWDFLKSYKKDKIMIMTTHSLDEAEYVGDRIGIMSDGKYTCSGTSSYLKNKFTCGYNINFLSQNEMFPVEKKFKFLRELQSIDASAAIKVLSNEVFVINMKDTDNKINEVFTYIDRVKDSYMIENYTISTTSLEDVFIKLNNSSIREDILFTEPQRISQLSLIQDEPLLGKKKSSCSKFKANLLRYTFPLWRNKNSFILELLVSLRTVFLYIFGFAPLLKNTDSIYQNINSVLYKNPIYYYSLTDKFNIAAMENCHILKSPITLIELKGEDINFEANDDINTFSNKIYSSSKYKNERAVILFKENEYNELEINILYQLSARNYLIAVRNLISATILQNEYGLNTTITDSYGKIPQHLKKDMQTVQTVLVLISIFYIWYSFINLSGYMVETPLNDRTSKLKHILYLSGANIFNYWISLGLIDFLKYLLFMLIVFPFLIYTDICYSVIALMSIPYNIASNLMLYCFSFTVNKTENGRQIYLLIIFASSVILPTTFLLRHWFNDKTLSYDYFTDFTPNESDILPPGTLLVGMIKISFSRMLLNKSLSEIMITAMYSWIMFGGQIVIFLLLLVLLEKRVIQRILHLIFISLCLSSEKRRDSIIQSKPKNIRENSNPLVDSFSSITEDNLKNQAQTIYVNPKTTIIKNISKTYCTWCCRKIRAVKCISIALEPNEKFGLLGFNGSGKTTTFKTITKELLYDTGSVTLFGCDLKTDINKIRKYIGYCPQENAVFDFMTVKETLKYFKTLKNVKTKVEELLPQFGLEKYQKTFCRNLSGGNKRKLCFAIAAMSHPKLLLLDEPSTGVDPESRRRMWKNINDLAKFEPQFNMILSTHSMEEAEILCDTVGWLKEGKFVCVGNPEKLKIETSQGYYLHIKFHFDNEDLRLRRSNLVLLRKSIVNPEALNKCEEKELIEHLTKLENILQSIRCYCNDIEMIDIRSDKSFDLKIVVKNECQGKLFSRLLSSTKIDNEVSEMNINMQSLENILTLFERDEEPLNKIVFAKPNDNI